jgi:pimeloyl-ACP methyl ester carboxylesterase
MIRGGICNIFSHTRFRAGGVRFELTSELKTEVNHMQLARQLVLKYIRTKFKLLSSLSKQRAAEKAFRLFITPQHRNKKKLPPAFEKAEQLQFAFKGNTVRGYRWNKGGEKKLLILHGFESSVVNFDRYVKPLVKKGYEVLAFDAPAHGRSTGRTITVIDYKDLVHYIYDHYGPIDAFITHSFGGLTLSLAIEEIPHDENMKMVLIAPAAETKTAIDNFFRLLKLDQDVRGEFEKLITRMSGKEPDWYSISRVAPKIRAQVLFLQDRDDHMTPITDVEPIMKKQYPNFKFIISEGLGHRRIYRDSHSLQAIMDFL